MSKLNPQIKKVSKFDTERLAGGSGNLCAKQDNVQLLRRAVLANLLWEDIAYMDGVSVSDEIARLIPLCDGESVFNIALEARIDQKLRHTPLFIAREMCRYKEHKRFVSKLLPLIITRADMITDFVALYWKDGKESLCNQAKKGLALSFYNFNEYKLAKYDRNSSIKLRDVMFMVHPKPRNEYEKELFSKIANRTLATPDTWEVALSRGEDKKSTWTRLIEDGKIGGLAMLRNISNMMRVDVDSNVIRKGINNLTSSMLLPLDYYKSYKHNREFGKDIEDVMIKSYEHLPKLPGNTLFIVDVSGSMDSRISDKSEFTREECACVMAMLACNQCERYQLVVTAGNDSSRIGEHEHIKYPSKGFDIINQIKNHSVGWGGIFTRQCLEWCKENFNGEEFDRIIIFSDSQDCDYPDKRVPHPFGKYNYICDVSAHTRGINYKGVWDAEISGFSDKFITFIAAHEGITNTFDE